MFEKSIKFFNSPLSLLILGFIGTSVVGTYINNQYHEKEWKNKARFTILKEQLEESKKFEQEILILSNKRYSHLERIYNELVSNDLNLAKKTWKEYYKIVIQWNNNTRANKNKLLLFFTENLANQFLDDNENKSDVPNSLHHNFRISHNKVLKLLRCFENTCNNLKELTTTSRLQLDNLGKMNDRFSYELQKSLINKQNKLISN